MTISVDAKTKDKTKGLSEMEKLLATEPAIKIPQVGEMVEGKVISVSKNEVHLDIDGLTTGVSRGAELYDESGEYSDLKIGEKVSATVLELENENREMELSFRQAGHKKAWDELEKIYKEGRVVEAKIIEANKGGLIVRVGRVDGFLPVSQLTTEHYPRVEGGDKNRILERLNNYVGQTFKVKIIDVNEAESKLIVSEKEAFDREYKKLIDKYKIGDVVEGKVTGIVNFGAFIEFDDGLEGLVHISELAWQRIDDPRDFVKVGDEVKAEIISIEDSKISLSIKKLKQDPWIKAVKRYKVGQVVRSKVLKINPFGVFIELDKDIHGLAHISELSSKLVRDPSEIVKVGETYNFKILSIEPKEHRLGLSMRALEEDRFSKKKSYLEKRGILRAKDQEEKETPRALGRRGWDQREGQKEKK